MLWLHAGQLYLVEERKLVIQCIERCSIMFTLHYNYVYNYRIVIYQKVSCPENLCFFQYNIEMMKYSNFMLRVMITFMLFRLNVINDENKSYLTNQVNVVNTILNMHVYYHNIVISVISATECYSFVRTWLNLALILCVFWQNNTLTTI